MSSYFDGARMPVGFALPFAVAAPILLGTVFFVATTLPLPEKGIPAMFISLRAQRSYHLASVIPRES